MMLDDIPLFGLLKGRMGYLNERQRLISQNVANADTPGFRPKDLAEPRFSAGGAASPAGLRGGGLALAPADGITLAGVQSGDAPGTKASARFETKPSGNAVNLEEEMMRVAQNQSDYALAAGLYEKSLKMLRTAAGKR